MLDFGTNWKQRLRLLGRLLVSRSKTKIYAYMCVCTRARGVCITNLVMQDEDGRDAN